MNRSYVVCHMVTSIDGKVTGDFLFREQCNAATEVYYGINRDYHKSGFNGFVCGRVTMEQSFTNGGYLDLSSCAAVTDWQDYVPNNLTGFYAVAFDPKGKLGWKTNRIVDPDGDEGYNGAQIVEVVTKQADPRYLGYLQSINIPYIVAGTDVVDVAYALEVLRKRFGAEKLLLEGGSVIDGYFLRANCVDELSLVVSPTVADANSKPLFDGAIVADFSLCNVKQYPNGVLWLNYKR